MKKTISVLLALLMVLSLLPATAMAAEPEDEVRQEMLQQEDVIPLEETDLQPNEMDDEEQPDPALAAAETENAPAPLNASGDIEDLLVEKGFNVPMLTQQFNVDVPAWSSFEDLASLSLYYSSSGKVGEATLTLKTATAEAWNTAYRQSSQWFQGVSNEVRSVFSYYAPAGADNFSFCIADENSPELSNFINGNYTNQMSAQSGCNMGFRIADVASDYIKNTDDYSVYYLVVWRKSDGEIIDKYALKINIETEEFSHPQENLADRLKAADFVAPEIDEAGAGISGALILELPAGLKKGVDYNYTYNKNTGELNITISKGKAANWKTAYLDSVIGEKANFVAMGIDFQSVDGSTQGLNWRSWNKSDLWALLQDDIWDDAFSFEEDTRCGAACWMADARDNGAGDVTISCEKGTQQFYQAALWKDENGTVLARYLIKVTVNYKTFSHTVEALSMNKLNAADAARFGLKLENPNSFMTTILKNGKVTLVPKAGAVLTDKWDNIGVFWVKAPAGYTLQSCYISYRENHTELVREFANDGVPLRMEDANTNGHTQLTLRWKNNDAKAADLIEVLDVYVDSDWGNLSNHAGQPDVRDVQAIYDWLTQDKMPDCGDSAACDVNMDDNVDVYDLQYLYECVAGI